MLASTALLSASGFSLPLDNDLLPLVPSGAEIVAGFDNHSAGHEHGRLLLSTHNDRLDLDDWQALAGVDNRRVFDKVIEVAASSARGPLAEHLLLVAGRFDRERIFKAAELTGAQRSECLGETVMLIKPFAREQGEMLDTRWLVILDDRVAMLGSPSMVQDALRRRAIHADIDMPLMERLTQMHRDVTSWSILLGSPKTERSLASTQPNSVLTRLLDGSDVLMIGARFRARIRVDFSLYGRDRHDRDFLMKKSASFADVFAKQPSLDSNSQQSQSRLGKLSMDPETIQGSVELSQKEFEQWNRQGGFARRVQTQVVHLPSHGE
jgi:hypothetical protein